MILIVEILLYVRICLWIHCFPIFQDEWDEDEAKGKITFYYKGIARELEVESELIQKPSFMKIKLAIE